MSEQNRGEGDLMRKPDSEGGEKRTLFIAMAIKRLVRSDPSVSLAGDPTYVSSRDMEAALVGDGLRLRSERDLIGDSRMNVVEGSSGIDEAIIITKVEGVDNEYLLRLPPQ